MAACGVILTLALLAIILFCTTMGVVLNYSPVPFWDMWTSDLDFYRAVREGLEGMWWSQHNEHRIFFSKVLFFLNNRFFGGQAYFLLGANYALMLLIISLYCRLLIRALGSNTTPSICTVLLATCVALLGSWGQHENLIWGFQSQFLLAQLLPSLSLYLMYRAVNTLKFQRCFFWAAVSIGFASIGTMANGVLALPMLFVYAVINRMGVLKSASIALFALLACWLYFHDFYTSPNHQSVSSIIDEHPQKFAVFAVAYLGGWFYHLFDFKYASLFAIVMGVVYLGALGNLVWLLMKYRNDAAFPLASCMVLICGYVIAGAAATALGRASFGLDQAFASRYVTPQIVGWVAMAIGYVAIPKVLETSPRLICGLCILLLLGLLPQQLRALKSQEEVQFEKQMAALAFALEVRDPDQTGIIFPDMAIGQRIATDALQRRLSVYRQRAYSSLDTDVRVAAAPATPVCVATVTSVKAVSTDTRFLRITGDLVLANSSDTTVGLVFSEGGAMSGLALMFDRRPFWSRVAGAASDGTRFSGYMKVPSSGRHWPVAAQAGACTVSFVQAPP